MAAPKPISFCHLNKLFDLRIIIIIIQYLTADNAFGTQPEHMGETSPWPKALGPQFQLSVSHRTPECCS